MDFTEAQRTAFQDKLPDRVAKRDRYGTFLQGYHVEYSYAEQVDFGLLLSRPDHSAIISRYEEVQDNAGSQIPVLVFSRPYNPIYLVYPSCIHWVDRVNPAVYIDSPMVGRVCIAVLENFLREVPNVR